jgi:hypothetical protein
MTPSYVRILSEYYPNRFDVLPENLGVIDNASDVAVYGGDPSMEVMGPVLTLVVFGLLPVLVAQ